MENVAVETEEQNNDPSKQRNQQRESAVDRIQAKTATVHARFWLVRFRWSSRQGVKVAALLFASRGG